MNPRTAIYPGSFDPLTYGHLDIIRRAAQIFDRLVVAVAVSEAKSPLFSVGERLVMIQESIQDIPGVTAKSLDGLLVNFAQREGAFVIVRGLRAVSDFEFEFQMALMNRRLEARLETIFLPAQEDVTFVSSRIVKEVARLGGDVSAFVPDPIAIRLREKFRLD